MSNEEAPLWETYRPDFPVTAKLVYLNHAAVAPLCRPAAQAMVELTEDVLRFGALHYDTWMEAYAGIRSAAAQLIGASPDEIAIVKNTSEGISTIALGFDWKPGDRVVAFREEFPANYFPWARLEARSVTVTWLSIYDSLDVIAEAAQGARLLSISYVNYLSGYRVDLAAIGRICRENGCFFFVDAIQGVGAFPLHVDDCKIDALAADGHKWMLGPEGNGILYVRKEWQDRIDAVEFGWTNPAQYFDYASRDMTLRSDAGRYECGTLNTVGCFGLRASIQYLNGIGIDRICAAIDVSASHLEHRLRAKGYELMQPRTPSSGSGIVSFRHPAKDSRVLLSELKRNGVMGASRQGWLRFAPHFYISPADLNHALSCLPEV